MLTAAKAIIFDMDGVLFDSTDCHSRAFAETLQDVGISEYPYAQISGMKTEAAIQKIFAEMDRTLEPHELDSLVASKQTKARQLLQTHGRLREYADKLIPRLHKQYRLALASSASRPTVEIYLNLSGHEPFFEFCLDGGAVKNGKPDPEIYHLAIEKFQFDPKQCLVVEDAVNGVTAACAAGASVIGITGTDQATLLQQAGATVVVGSLQELEILLLKNHADS